MDPDGSVHVAAPGVVFPDGTPFVCTGPSWRPGPRAGRIEVARVDVPAA